MGAQVVSFLNWSLRATPSPVADWSQQELAEFYRVESALMRAGLRIETDRGMSDEGEPWFVFLRAEDGEVVVHFARIDGEYIIAGPAYEKVARGYDFNALVRNMIDRHPLVQPQQRGSNVLFHPAALLAAIVGTAFFKTGEAKAMENDRTPAHRKPAAASSPAGQAASAGVQHFYVNADQALAILAGAMFALEPRWDHHDRVAASYAAMHAETAATRAELRGIDLAGTGNLNFEGLRTAAPHAAALAHVPAILALTALLDVIADGGTSDTSGAVSVASAPHEAPHVVLTEGEGTRQAPVYLDIQLRAGVLPNVEAVELLREVGGKLEKIAVVSVDKIPEALAEIIASGAHISGATGIVDSPVETPAATPDQNLPDTGHTVTPPVAANDDSHHSAGEPPVVAPPPAPAPQVDGYRLYVQKVIDYFIAHVPEAEVITTGLEVIMYDSRVLHHSEQLEWADSLSFHFSDGSTISLVGEHSTLYHDLT